MKIGILTHYNVNNQGAQLQLYALHQTLKELGHEPVVLSYTKNYDFAEAGIGKRNNISVSSVPYILKEFLLKKGFRLTYHNYKKFKLNKEFRKTNFVFKNYAQVPMNLAVVGSDEVLSLQYGANEMMYGHGVNAERLIAYAPCFGQTDMERVRAFHCEELIKSGLKMFSHLSARDEHTQAMIKELSGKDAPLVCDPVLLYDFSGTHTAHKTIKKDYMVAYAYDRGFTSEQEVRQIKAFAKKRGLLVVSPGTYHKWCDVNVACGPLEWIEYFRGAKAVVTNTFHGTVLAAITNTPMAVKTRSFKTRSLLSSLGLEERKMDSCDEIERVFEKDIDFAAMNDKWNGMREASMAYLKDALAGGEGVN